MTERIKLEKVMIRGSRASLVISSQDEPLTVRPEVVHHYRLEAGTVLTRSQVDHLLAESARMKCVNAATRLLAMRQHSIEELRFKLRRKEHEVEVIDTVIAEFKQLKLLDDAAYARTIVESVLRKQPCGRAYLLSRLDRRRIDRTVATHAADEALSAHQAKDLAVAALQRRWREYRQFELETARRKAYNYLARRGFNFEQARAAFDYIAHKETIGGND